MKTTKFARKPFYVDAVRVTNENIKEVAAWCEGEIYAEDDSEMYIKVRVHRPLTEDQTKAHVGKWVLYAGTGYKVYTDKAFQKSFEKVHKLTKAQADEAGIKVPHEKRPPAVTKESYKKQKLDRDDVADMTDINARINSIHGPGASDALDKALADGSIFSDSSRDEVDEEINGFLEG